MKSVMLKILSIALLLGLTACGEIKDGLSYDPSGHSAPNSYLPDCSDSPSCIGPN